MEQMLDVKEFRTQDKKTRQLSYTEGDNLCLPFYADRMIIVRRQNRNK